MDKFIKLLLEKENTVILPGFGAIVVENENTGKLMFNEYLKFNDGKLDNIIVENSNMSLQEAQNHISKYIKEIQIQLDKGETYDIFELGSFTKDADESIAFSGQKPGSASAKEAGTKKETVAPSEKKTAPVKKAAPKKEEKPKEKEVAPSQSASNKSEAQKEEKAVPPKNKSESESETKNVTPATPSKDSSKEDKKEKQTKEKEAAKLAKEKAKKEKEQAKAEQKKAKQAKKGEKAPKKKAGVLFWILLFVLLLLAGGGVYVGLNYDEVKTYMGWDQFEQEELKKQEAEKAKKEAEAKAKAEKEEKERLAREKAEEEKRKAEEEKKQQLEEEKAVEVQTQGNFHLIAGAFSDKSNADDLVTELKSKGHPAQIIGVYGQLHFVSVRSFNSLQEARNNASNVQGDAPGAWVFRQ